MPKAAKSFTSFGRRVFSMRIEFDRDDDGPHEITFPVHASSRESTPVLDWDSDAGHAEDTMDVEETVEAVGGGEEDDDVEESPYDRLRDKRFYRKPNSFYYYLYSKASHIDQPPPHPAALAIHTDTLFIHRNPGTSQIRTWIWGKRPQGAEGEDAEGGNTWIPLQEREERRFDHGTYYYGVSSTGMPSWIVYETLRKNKYRASGSSKSPRVSGSGGGGGQ